MTAFVVRCRDPNCSYSETFADKYNASGYAQYHALRTGHKDIVMEALDAE